MTPVVDVLHGASPAVADVLVASVWQSVLLTGAVALGLRLLPGVPAGTRSALWTAVLVLIVLLPVGSAVVPHAGAGAARAVHLASDWSLGVVCFWGLLSLFRAVQLGVSAARLRVLARSAKPVAVGEGIAPLLEFGSRVCGSRSVVLCTSELVDRPSVVGFLRPRILLSPQLLETLSGAELEQIVLHEMEHLRRGDQWTNLLQQLSLVLLPWNPAVLWLNRRLCFERELACDDGVLRATTARRAYAACLVRLAEESMLRRGVSLALGALGAVGFRARESELVRRVRRILGAGEPAVGRGFLRAVTAVVLAGALGLSVLLARSPRLVEFAGSPETVAAAARVEAPAIEGNGGGRAVMVKAVVAGPTGARAVALAGARAVAGRAVVSKRAIARRRVMRVDSLRAAAGVEMRGPVWRDEVSVRPVITLAAAEDSQRVYAAVPWQGGWLLFQL